MQSVIEGEFEPRSNHDSAATSGPEENPPVPDDRKVVPIDSAGQSPAKESAPEFDLGELERSLEKLQPTVQAPKPEIFKPTDYADPKAADRIIDGFQNGEPTYKPEPKPDSEKRPRRRPPRPSAERQYRSTHDLYKAKGHLKPNHRVANEYDHSFYAIATKWVTKATHLAAIVIALLLILHYFPLPAG